MGIQCKQTEKLEPFCSFSMESGLTQAYMELKLCFCSEMLGVVNQRFLHQVSLLAALWSKSSEFFSHLVHACAHDLKYQHRNSKEL